MRQQPTGRRPRGRSNRKHFVPHRSQNYDSHGPDVRVRGNAMQVYEKYVNLARDAFASGDRIAAEGFQQYAEHYYRIINDTTDPQRPAAERPAGERPAGEPAEVERAAPERAAPERSGPERTGSERAGSETKTAGGQPYPMDAEQPFVDGDALGAPTGGNGKAREAKPDDKSDAEEPGQRADGDGAAEASPAEEPKTKPRARGRPRSRAKAGNGAAAKAEGEDDAKPSASEAGDSSS